MDASSHSVHLNLQPPLWFPLPPPPPGRLPLQLIPFDAVCSGVSKDLALFAEPKEDGEGV